MLILFSQYSFAQQKEEYCEVIFVLKPFSNKLNMLQNFGNSESTVLKDSQGENVDFYSLITGLNEMAKNGWVLVMNYIVEASTKEVFPRFVFKRDLKTSISNVEEKRPTVVEEKKPIKKIEVNESMYNR